MKSTVNPFPICFQEVFVPQCPVSSINLFLVLSNIVMLDHTSHLSPFFSLCPFQVWMWIHCNFEPHFYLLSCSSDSCSSETFSRMCSLLFVKKKSFWEGATWLITLNCNLKLAWRTQFILHQNASLLWSKLPQLLAFIKESVDCSVKQILETRELEHMRYLGTLEWFNSKA